MGTDLLERPIFTNAVLDFDWSFDTPPPCESQVTDCSFAAKWKLRWKPFGPTPCVSCPHSYKQLVCDDHKNRAYNLIAETGNPYFQCGICGGDSEFVGSEAL